MTRRQNRVFAALKLPASVPELLTHAQAILDACSTHPLLVDPTPSMAELTALRADLDAKQTDLGLGGRGKKPARDAAEDRLRQALTLLSKCVEGHANDDLDHAEAFIAAAFMTTRAASTRHKKAFAVTTGLTSGSVNVDVRAAPGTAAYKWLVSLDGGTTWGVAKVTLQSSVMLTGLPAGTYVHFRCAITLRDRTVRETEAIVFLVK